MRHKQILDVAAERPDASIEEIAREVPSATPELVERVLDDYGDPAATDEDADDGASDEDADDGASDEDADDGASDEDADSARNGEAGSAAEASVAPAPDRADGSGYPSPGELSDKQLATLRAIADNPDATQRELSDQLGVTAATISRRVNTIEGFEWADREAFAGAVLSSEDGGTGSNSDGAVDPATNDHEESADAPDEESATGEAGETTEAGTDAGNPGPEREVDGTELEDRRENADEGQVFDDVELTHKVVKACVNSPEISPSEEVRILRRLLGRER